MRVYKKEPQGEAQACIIWMHGLGADSKDMIGLVDQLSIKERSIKHVFIDAPSRPVTLNGGMVMPAWYDILGFDLVDREDKEGIKQSQGLINQVIESQLKVGFVVSQLFLAGFSQGGAMALHTALHLDGRLGGVIALSAYLPMAMDNQPILNQETPFFIGSGSFDTVVSPKWTQLSKDWLLEKGYHRIFFQQYPMEHSICLEEIKDLEFWISKQVQGAL